MGRKPCCDKPVAKKKGPWDSVENRKLVNFMLTNTPCCWNDVPKLAGLQRCGKSCRLRWNNYLRPGVKCDLLTEQEEKLLFDLHSQLGNRWSKIAESFPGRTDNHLKNHWNTHIKKKLFSTGVDSFIHGPHNTEPSLEALPSTGSCVLESSDNPPVESPQLSWSSSFEQIPFLVPEEQCLIYESQLYKMNNCDALDQPIVGLTGGKIPLSGALWEFAVTEPGYNNDDPSAWLSFLDQEFKLSQFHSPEPFSPDKSFPLNGNYVIGNEPPVSASLWELPLIESNDIDATMSNPNDDNASSSSLF